MSYFTCPVCGGELSRGEKTALCPGGHCYDISKKGYINLLMSQKSSKHSHGDDREMVLARTAFLETGYYAPLADAAADEAALHTDKPRLVDIGCGEGYYTSIVAKAVRAAFAFGVDVSKAALDSAARKYRDIAFAVASGASVPLADESCNLILNIFAPDFPDEFSRLLSPGGVIIKVIPDRRHLYSLKERIYDSPYENEVVLPSFPSAALISDRRLSFTFNPSGGDIETLFRMTPYFHKTSPSDMKKLAGIKSLECEAEFRILTYEKQR